MVMDSPPNPDIFPPFSFYFLQRDLREILPKIEDEIFVFYFFPFFRIILYEIPKRDKNRISHFYFYIFTHSIHILLAFLVPIFFCFFSLNFSYKISPHPPQSVTGLDFSIRYNKTTKGCPYFHTIFHILYVYHSNCHKPVIL